MVADASIYGQIKPAQPLEGPLDQYGKVLNLKALMGQSKLHDLQTQQLEQNMGEEQATRDVFKNAAPGATLESLLPDVMRASPKAGISMTGQITKQKQEAATTAHTEAQTKDITAGHVAGAWAAMAKGGGSDEAVKQVHDTMAPLVGEEKATSVTNQLLAMPPEMRLPWMTAQAGQHKTGQEALKIFFPPAHMQDSGGQITPVSTSTLPGGPAAGSPVPGGQPLVKTETPEGKAAREQAVVENQKNRDTRLLTAGIDATGKPLNAGKPGETIDLGKVSPADMQAGYRYFTDGTLPPNMGRGNQGAAQATRIRDIAAQLSTNLGVAPEEVRANQVAFKGSGAALSQLARREAQIGSNVRNFDFNADQVLQLSDKVDRTGTPVVNAWLQAGRRAVSGNPELSAFDVAVKTTVNEFAQIVGGTTAGASTEGEKQKAEKLLNAAQTPEQIKAVINQMRLESQNRMKSFADQKAQTLATMRAGGPKKDETAGSPANAKPSPAASGAIVATVKNDADFEKLKPGTRFIAPDGTTRTKQ